MDRIGRIRGYLLDLFPLSLPLPRYYLLGFNNSAQEKNPGLPQTIGWEDALHSGANGTFDPLAEPESH